MGEMSLLDESSGRMAERQLVGQMVFGTKERRERESLEV